jgi:predicted Rossmann fold nucleotide-binding protein DprA/Smf involved in DNA uptake
MLAQRGVPLRAGESGREDPLRSEGRPELDRIVMALHTEPATRDELAARLGLRPEQLASELLELEIEGRVAEERDGRLRVQPRR